MKPSYIPYLHLNDYLTQIRSGQYNGELLDAINEGGIFERRASEAFAMDEIRSILDSYFYLDFEFRDIDQFYFNRKYFAGDRIILDFPYWVPSNGNEDEFAQATTSYNIGDCVINQNLLDNNGIPLAFCCAQPNNDTKWISANWTQIGSQYDIYYVNFPYPIFQLVPDKQIGIEINGLYRAGLSRVCWVNHIWKCISDSVILSHHQQEQFYSTNDIPAPNIFPNAGCFGGSFELNPYGLGEGNNSPIIGTGFAYGNKQWCDEGEFSFQNVLPFHPNYNTKNGIYCDNKGYCWNGNNQVYPNSLYYIKNWVLGDNRSQTMVEIVIAIALHQLLSRNSYMLKERQIKRDWAYAKLEKIKLGKNTTLIPIIQPEQPGGGFTWGGDVKKINQWK